MKTVFISTLFLLVTMLSFSQKKRIKVGDISRSYILYVPKSIDKTKPTPLVFNFHGGGMKASEQMLYTEMNTTAEKNKFIVIYPKGIKGNWNVGFDMDYDKGTDDVSFVKSILKEIKESYTIDTNSIFATGLSRGGFFTYRLAIEMPEVFSAIAPVGAPMPLEVKNKHIVKDKLAVMLIQGKADSLVKFKGKTKAYLSAEETIEYWVKHNENKGVVKTKSIDVIDDETQVTIQTYKGKYGVALITIKNGGHTWPGANDFNIGYLLGKTTHDIHANDLIWDFFVTNKRQ